MKLNTNLKNTLKEFDIRIILSEFLKIPLKNCCDILNAFNKNHELIEYDFQDDDYNAKYSEFLILIENLAKSDKKLSEQIIDIYEKLFLYARARLFKTNYFQY